MTSCRPVREYFAVAIPGQVEIECGCLTHRMAMIEARMCNRRAALNKYRVYRVLIKGWEMVRDEEA